MGYDDYYDLYSDSDGYDDDLDGLSFFGIGYDYHDSMDDSETDDDEDDEDDY